VKGAGALDVPGSPPLRSYFFVSAGHNCAVGSTIGKISPHCEYLPRPRNISSGAAVLFLHSKFLNISIRNFRIIVACQCFRIVMIRERFRVVMTCERFRIVMAQEYFRIVMTCECFRVVMAQKYFRFVMA
jgi:hypothetical protein